MDSIKTTPLVIFIILLIVLVISVVFGYRASEEGFTAYQFAKQPIDNVWIPQYTAQSSSSTVYKLYDNLFFDNKNGNLIEIDASGNGSTANTDNTGATITNVYVTTRAAPTHTSRYQINLSGGNVVPQDTTESLIASMPNSYQSFKYVTQSPNTDKYTVFYMPWNDSTYVHIVQPNKNIGTILFGPANTIQDKFYAAADASLNLSAYNQDTDPSNNKSGVDPSYNATSSVYQLSHTVKFDTQNANLIINTGAPGYFVYNRNGTVSPANPSGATNGTNIQNVAFNAFTVLDTVGQNVVLYASVGKKTLVALFGYKDATMSGYSLVNVKRFTESGLDMGSLPTQAPAPVPVTPTDTSSNKPPVSESDFYKMYWFMQTQGMPGIPNTNRFSDDYLLKTQIVPPVCPTCPSCPACAANPSATSTCSNCGGKGGSGTIDASGSTIVQKDTRTNIAGAVSNLGQDVGGVANNVINTTGGLITGAAKGTKDVATDVVVGTKNVATDVVVGTKNLVTGAASEAESLLKSAGSGIKDILTQDHSKGQGQGSQTDIKPKGYGRWQQGDFSSLGTNNQPAIDQYSYYGSLPAKPASNYMPVTADFSAFGR